MRSNVTAILVAKHSGETLAETISAIRAQTVQPDRVIVIAAGPTQLAEELGRAGFDRVVSTGPRTTFGQAVALAAHAIAPSGEGLPEWMWLLAEDTAPEQDALERMLTTVQSTGTAAVAGPKLVDWHDPRMILELGQSLTWAGSRWVIDRQELDQQQYDHTEDVLGVGPVGMLVRHDLWTTLGGFDPALPVVDDGLDFSVRARLAGFRVIVVPEARIRTQRSGIAGPEVRRRRSVMRRGHRLARAAELHRRLVYAPAALAPFMWLGLPIVGLLMMLWALVRERPGTMFGELHAALAVFFKPGRVLRARRRLRGHNTAGWRAIRPLRADRKTVKSVRMVRREAILTALGRQRRDLNFVGSGGLAVLIAGIVMAVAFTWWAFGASFLTGGGFAPLSDNVAALWGHTVSATSVNPLSLASFAETAPADPFTWVLAVLGTLTFWNPSVALVALVVCAVPVAALGGWIWGSRVSESTSARVLAGVLWAIAPMALGALAQGRPHALVLAATLPWLLHALALATRSWSWVGVASLLAAVVLAAAPVLWPAALVLLIAGALLHPKQSARILAVLIAPAVLVLPRALQAFALGRPLDVLADPGIPVAGVPATPWQMLLGFATFGLDGWGNVLARFDTAGLLDGSTLPVTLTVGFLLVPLAVVALLGLYTGHPRFTALAALAGALGLTTALVSPKLLLVPSANGLVGVWAGSGLALYWISVLSLAALGAHMLFRAAPAVTAVVLAGAVLIVAPGMVNLTTGQVAIAPDRAQVPAVVAAESHVDPAARTLFITSLSQTELRARVLTGTGAKLDEVMTSETTAPVSDGAQIRADLVAALASTGDERLGQLLGDTHVKFIVLGSGPRGAASELRSALQTVFDQHPALTPVGDTQHGLLWRVSDGVASASALPADVEADEVSVGQSSDRTLSGRTIWAIQVAVLALLILLALPTGEVRELPEKRPRSGRRAARAVQPVGAAGAFGVGAEPVADETLFVKPAEPPADEVWELPDDDTIFADPSAKEDDR